MKFLMIASFADSLIGFRAPLIAALQAKDLEVHVAAPDLPPDSPVRLQMEAQGLKVHEVPMHRTGTDPVADLRTFLALYGLIRRIRPFAVMGYTIKPVIYGMLAARAARVPRRFALITGLGMHSSKTKSEAGCKDWCSGCTRFHWLALTRFFFKILMTRRCFVSGPS